MSAESLSSDGYAHVPVLAEPLLAAFAALPARGGLLIDCTLGGGGHSALLLAAHPQLHLVGLDQDPAARAAAAERLAPFGERAEIVASNFADYRPREPALAVLADLGVSSPQLDGADRGFSFRADGPLDMRMNPEGGETAAQLIERLEETELANLIYAFGEERLFTGTAALAYLVAGCYPPPARRGRLHPATRTFQALRIAVNDELGALDRLLQQAPDWLESGGLLAVISFHSLEDRRVKTAFVSDDRLQRVTRKPLIAGEAEAEANPRSRSAKLRVAQRR